jgi:hypothetical protein
MDLILNTNNIQAVHIWRSSLGLLDIRPRRFSTKGS